MTDSSHAAFRGSWQPHISAPAKPATVDPTTLARNETMLKSPSNRDPDQCRFVHFGCQVRCGLNTMQEHEVDARAQRDHLAMLAKHVDRQQQALQTFQDKVIALGDRGVRSPSGAISPNSLSPSALKEVANSPPRANTPPQDRLFLATKTPTPGGYAGGPKKTIRQATAATIDAAMRTQLADIQNYIDDQAGRVEAVNNKKVLAILSGRTEQLTRMQQREQGQLRYQVTQQMDNHVDSRLSTLSPSTRNSLHTYGAAIANSSGNSGSSGGANNTNMDVGSSHGMVSPSLMPSPVVSPTATDTKTAPSHSKDPPKPNNRPRIQTHVSQKEGSGNSDRSAKGQQVDSSNKFQTPPTTMVRKADDDQFQVPEPFLCSPRRAGNEPCVVM